MKDEIIVRTYLIGYGVEPWFVTWWKNLMDSPPCKGPNHKKNKEYEYDIEFRGGVKNELYLHLIGRKKEDLDGVEAQIAKYGIGRIERNRVIQIVEDSAIETKNEFLIRFCRDKGYEFRKEKLPKEKIKRP
ncbi:MAG: hypothetical protein ACXQS7_00925 [Candidatus Syntropharchaeia archaeon]